MSNLTSALIVVLAVNVMLFLGQIAVIGVGEDIGVLDQRGFNYTGGMIERFDTGGYVLNETNPSSIFPTATSSDYDSESGGFITDIFSTAKEWLFEKLGLNYVVAILRAPYNFLSALGLPQAFTFGVGSLWYGITIFLIVAFILGRDA